MACPAMAAQPSHAVTVNVAISLIARASHRDSLTNDDIDAGVRASPDPASSLCARILRGPDNQTAVPPWSRSADVIPRNACRTLCGGARYTLDLTFDVGGTPVMVTDAGSFSCVY